MAEKNMTGLSEVLKATVISILPWKLYEHKPTVYSSTLPARIPAADFDKKEVVVYHLADGVRRQYVPGFPQENDPRSIVHYPVPALQIAEALVNDYIQAKDCVYLGDESPAIPGLQAFDGVYDIIELKTRFKDDLESLFDRQNRWLLSLVQKADDDWQRYHNHKMLTDEQRIASKCLHLERDWNIDVSKAGQVRCPVCQSHVAISAIVCSFCRAIINPEKYKNFSFVGEEKKVSVPATK